MIPLSFLPDVSQYQPFFEQFEFPKLFKVKGDQDNFQVHISNKAVALEFANEVVTVRIHLATNKNGLAISMMQSAYDKTTDTAKIEARYYPLNMDVEHAPEMTPEDLREFASTMDSRIAARMKNIYDLRQISFRSLDEDIQNYLNRNVVATPSRGFRVPRQRLSGLGQRDFIKNEKYTSSNS